MFIVSKHCNLGNSNPTFYLFYCISGLLHVRFPLTGWFCCSDHHGGCFSVRQRSFWAAVCVLTWKLVTEPLSWLLLGLCRCSGVARAEVMLLMHVTCSSWTLQARAGGSAWLTLVRGAVITLVSPHLLLTIPFIAVLLWWGNQEMVCSKKHALRNMP